MSNVRRAHRWLSTTVERLRTDPTVSAVKLRLLLVLGPILIGMLSLMSFLGATEPRHPIAILIAAAGCAFAVFPCWCLGTDDAPTMTRGVGVLWIIVACVWYVL